MGLFDRLDAAAALDDLLERERAAALAGRFDILARLEPEKRRRLEALARDGAGAARLRTLRQRAERNRTLLLAMQAGVQAAMRAVQAPRSDRDDLRTYDADGHSQTLGAGSQARGRRA